MKSIALRCPPVIVTIFVAMTFNMSSSYAQTYISVLDLNSTTITSQEQTELTKIQQKSDIVTSWLTVINPIENHLNGEVLSITLPEGSTIYTFEADNVTSYKDGEYYWAGYNTDGSSAILRKGTDDFLGHFYIASTGYYYELVSISTDKAVLVKYTSTTIAGYGDCALGDEEDEDSDDEVEDRSGCEDNRIRVLFLHTAAAAALAPPSPKTVANSVIAQLNAIALSSGLPATDVFFELAGAHILNGFVESNDIDDDLSDFSDNSSAHYWRDQYKADIVVLLTAAAYTGASGKAKRIASSNSNAYCIVESPSAAGFSMTGAHEIAHIMGARHQRCTVCFMGGCDPLTNHHGYLVGSAFKTLMVQGSCGSGIRTRIGRLSNPDVSFMGFETGNLFNKNAHKAKSRADVVACFRDTYTHYPGGEPYILTSIEGPSTVPNCQGYYPFTSIVSQPYEAPLTYKWEISPIGVGNWTVVSTSSSYVLTDPGS